jgi:hypothetical protein
MPTPIYQCPTTGYRVQGWFLDNGGRDHTETYEAVTCLACRQVHLVNPHTGNVLDAGPFESMPHKKGWQFVIRREAHSRCRARWLHSNIAWFRCSARIAIFPIFAYNRSVWASRSSLLTFGSLLIDCPSQHLRIHCTLCACARRAASAARCRAITI